MENEEDDIFLPFNINLQLLKEIIENKKIIELIPFINDCIYLNVDIDYF